MGITPCMPDRHSSNACPGSRRWIRTTVLRVMSPTSCHCSMPRRSQGKRQQVDDCHRTFLPSPFGLVPAHGPTLPAGIPPVRSALPCFTSRFEMERGGSTALRARQMAQGVQSIARSQRFVEPSRQLFHQGSPRPCAPVASTRRRASSSGRLPSHLLGDLPGCTSECRHLGRHFPLRCFQRFLRPDVATEPAGRPTTPPPAVRPLRSSRTKRSFPHDTKRS